MKNLHLKLALAILLVTCGWLSYKLLQTHGVDPQKNVPDMITEAKTDAEIIAKSVDQKGYSKTVAIRKKAILSSGDISGLPISQSVLDSLRLDNLDKSSKLQQASAIIGKLEARNLRASTLIDSLNRKSYLYTDQFATVGFTPDSISGLFNVNWKIKLIRQDTKKRKNLFAPYTYYTTILSPDKRIDIGEFQNLSIESQKPTRWGIGLQGGYYFDPQQRQLLPAIGFGLSYNLIRF